MALVFELGLTKPVPKDTQVPPCVNPKYSKPTTPRTMEERRAVLGCFLVTSMYVDIQFILHGTLIGLESHRTYRKLMHFAGHHIWTSVFEY